MGVVRSIVVRAVMLACAGLGVVLPPSASAHRPPYVVTMPATDVGSAFATLNGVVTPNGIDTVYFFRYGASGYELDTPLASAGGGRAPVAVSAHIANLSPATTYHARLIAFSSFRVAVGDEVTFATQAAAALEPPASAAPPALPVPAAPPLAPPPLALSPLPGAPAVLVAPPPVLGERVNVAVRKGTVTVKVPGGTRFVSLSEFASIPVGSLVNTRRGSVLLRSALPNGGTQAGIFRGGLFEVRQSKVAGGLTELVLRGQAASCHRPDASGAAASRHKRRARRALWGSVRHGSFRTRGSNSVATVRGTVWYVEDRCDGTLTRVVRGSVLVRDLRHHRTIVVRAGHHYLARVRR
jgi:hypothetical protein